ncbi:unnamed protein product [Spodoptera exigua]|nr:unnamed protein product [Spodoptera exigua]
MHNDCLSIRSITPRYILVARQQGYLRILFNWFILVSWPLSEFTSCVTEQILPIECYITIAKENRGQISGFNLLQTRLGGNQGGVRRAATACSLSGGRVRRQTQCKTGQWCKFGGIVPSGNAHKVWVDRVDVLRPAPWPPPPAPPAVSARLYLDRMAEFSLKQILPSVCITHQIV